MKSLFHNLLLIFILVLLSTQAFCQKDKLSYYDSIGVMPSFKFYLPNGAVYTPDSLFKKNSTVIIYFKTDCPYCAKQADIISKSINDFKSVDFIFISRQDTTDIRNFAVIHKLENTNKVKFLQDKEKLYYTYYHASYTPSIHIYDKHKKLKLFKEGILHKDELLNYIQ